MECHATWHQKFGVPFHLQICLQKNSIRVWHRPKHVFKSHQLAAMFLNRLNHNTLEHHLILCTMLTFAIISIDFVYLQGGDFELMFRVCYSRNKMTNSRNIKTDSRSIMTLFKTRNCHYVSKFCHFVTPTSGCLYVSKKSGHFSGQNV